MFTRTRSRKSNRTGQSAFARLETQVKNHSAWRGDIPLVEASNMLRGEVSFTYVLSSGFDKYHYILSYVSDNLTVKHKNVRILIEQGEHIFRNGGLLSFGSIVELIPRCLTCSAAVCKPLE